MTYKEKLFYEFKLKANHRFNNKFNYSKSVYVNNSIKISINCPDHGEFDQSPISHIQSKYGCPKCGNIHSKKSRLSNTLRFIDSAVKIHGGEYDYTQVEYINQNTKVKIKCKKHGYFLQKPKKHLSGNKCKRCAKNLTTEDAIKLSKQVHGDLYDYSRTNYVDAKNKIEIKCKSHGSFFSTLNNHISKKSGCPKCAATYSKYEEFIKSILDENGIKYKERDRTLISPYEVDIYLPKYNLAIEVDGVYWHSENQGKDKDYHLNKTTLCEGKGVKLLHFRDIDIENKPNIIKHIILSELKIYKECVDLNDCNFEYIREKYKKDFLDKYSFDGDVGSDINIAIKYFGNIIALASFKKLSGGYELVCFCLKHNYFIKGVISGVIDYFLKFYKAKRIITKVNKSISSGELFKLNSFIESGSINPECMYFKTNNSKILYNGSKHLNDMFSAGNGWDRIWDCGYIILEKVINNYK